MKRTIFTIIISLVLSLSIFCGCTISTIDGVTSGRGNGDSSSSTENSSGSSSSSSSTGGGQNASDIVDSSMTDDSFTVTLNFPTSSTLPTDSEIEALQVQWLGSDDSDVHTAYFAYYKVTEDGVTTTQAIAYNNDCDGEYTIQIVGQLTDFSYNPNGINATNSKTGRKVTIKMYELNSWGNSANGLSPKDTYYQEIYSTGAYRITFKNKANVDGWGTGEYSYYFMFNVAGSTTGKSYTLETWASTTDDRLVITFDLYFYSNRKYCETLTGYSDYCGKNTKNLLVSLSKAAISSGGHSAYICCITVKDIYEEYPQTLDFYITYEGIYSGGTYNEADLEDYEENYYERDLYTAYNTVTSIDEETGEVTETTKAYDGGDYGVGTYYPLVEILTRDYNNASALSLTDFAEYNDSGNIIDTNIAWCSGGSLIHTAYDSEAGSTYQTITYGYDEDDNQITIRRDASSTEINEARAKVTRTLDSGFYYIWYSGVWYKVFMELNDCYYGYGTTAAQADGSYNSYQVYNFLSTSPYPLAGYGDSFDGILSYKNVLSYYKSTAIQINYNNMYAANGLYLKTDDYLYVHPVTEQMHYFLKAYSFNNSMFFEGEGSMETASYLDYYKAISTDDAHLFLYACGIFM